MNYYEKGNTYRIHFERFGCYIRKWAVGFGT